MAWVSNPNYNPNDINQPAYIWSGDGGPAVNNGSPNSYTPGGDHLIGGVNFGGWAPDPNGSGWFYNASLGWGVPPDKSAPNTPPPSYGLGPNGQPVAGGLSPGGTGSGGATPGTPGAPGGPGGAPSGMTDAMAIIRQTLDAWGLGSLANWAYGLMTSGAGSAQVMLELRNQQAYKERFPYMEALAAKGRAISESEAISIERSIAMLEQQYGLEDGWLDAKKLIANEKSPAELKADLDLWTKVVEESPPETRGELMRLYNVQMGDFLAFFIDPEKGLPKLEKQIRAVVAAGQAKATGFGSLSLTEAERLAEMNVSGEQAQAGFGQLATDRELFGTLPGQAQDTIGRDEQLSAAFGGNANARRRIENKRRRSQSTHMGGGGFASSQQGVVGAGSAR